MRLLSLVQKIISDDFKKFKRVKEVIKGGKVARRAHLRNYGRDVNGGVSSIEMLVENMLKNNQMFARIYNSGRD